VYDRSSSYCITIWPYYATNWESIRDLAQQQIRIGAGLEAGARAVVARSGIGISDAG
jgi:hypothetical protein